MKDDPTSRRSDAANVKAKERSLIGQAKVKAIRDRRRFIFPSVPTGKLNRVADANLHNTVFPRTVKDWTPTTVERIFKDGADSRKLGGDVMVGRLKGARIWTLALEERATCPLYRGCYGNNMQQARRWRHSAMLERGIEAEVRRLCAPGLPILIRLHVLGDFPTMEYLRMWVELMDDLPNLNVFGFTAHPVTSKIGSGIARVRTALGSRFSIRTSGTSGKMGAFTVDFPTERKRMGDAVVCPEQLSAMNGDNHHFCANCAVCWQTDHPIVFVEH